MPARRSGSTPLSPAEARAAPDEATHALALPASAAGDRLDAALARALPQYSRSRLRTWIDAGRVTLDGEPAPATRRVRGGENVVVRGEPDPREVAFAPEAIALNVVHEDAALLVIDKPAGLVV